MYYYFLLKIISYCGLFSNSKARTWWKPSFDDKLSPITSTACAYRWTGSMRDVSNPAAKQCTMGILKSNQRGYNPVWQPSLHHVVRVTEAELKNKAVRAAVLEKKAVTAIFSSEVGFTDCCYLVCKCGVLVTWTTGTGPDKRSFVKCISVVTNPRSGGDNETDIILSRSLAMTSTSWTPIQLWLMMFYHLIRAKVR